jgi:dimeric dUTPase (all-alpha-NTP-PPase superfamily)
VNLVKLFEAQRELGKVGLFAYDGPDRFNKLVLALLVELGECANEWRGFKFWSKNQKPRTKKARRPYMDPEDAEFYNPLLEEYVDGLHFLLELGLEFKVTYFASLLPYLYVRDMSIEQQYNELYADISRITKDRYITVFSKYLTLGESLGFTPEQIESAYFEKHAENLRRQAAGY